VPGRARGNANQRKKLAQSHQGAKKENQEVLCALAALRELLIINKKTPLNFLQAGRTAGPEQRRGRYNHDANNVESQVKEKRYKNYTI